MIRIRIYRKGVYFTKEASAFFGNAKWVSVTIRDEILIIAPTDYLNPNAKRICNTGLASGKYRAINDSHLADVLYEYTNCDHCFVDGKAYGGALEFDLNEVQEIIKKWDLKNYEN